MSMMALMLLAPVLPLHFPLLNLSTRDRNDARCQPLETFKWRWLCFAHNPNPNTAPFFVADAHRDDGKRFIVRADEKLTAFMQLESATREASG